MRGSGFRKAMLNLLSLLIISPFVPAICYPLEPMKIPEVEKLTPIDIEPNQKFATIGFEKIISSLKRDDAICHFPKAKYFKDKKFTVPRCNLRYPPNAKLVWGNSRRFMSYLDAELGDMFYETMGSLGYNVVGESTEAFEAVEDRESADYLIAAKIIGIASNMCERHDIFSAPMGVYVGEMYQKIEWTVYSPRYREKIAKNDTEAYVRQDQEDSGGGSCTFSKRHLWLRLKN